MAPHGPVTGLRPTPSGSLEAAASTDRVSLAVVILTRDEEQNLPHALATVAGWATEVWVVDAGSTDRTVDIAAAAGARVVSHAFTGYAAQRTWALRSLPFGVDWVLFLDADEAVMPELRDELRAVLPRVAAGRCGFYVKRRFVFWGSGSATADTIRCGCSASCATRGRGGESAAWTSICLRDGATALAPARPAA